MKTKKILAGTFVAAIVMFFLGWLIYGILLKDFMSANCNNTSSRPMEEMVWWALILANVVSGLLISLILNWAGKFTMGSGAKVGALVGFLIAFAFDLNMYAMSTMFSNFFVVIGDSIAYAILFAVSGMFSGWVMGKVGKFNGIKILNI